MRDKISIRGIKKLAVEKLPSDSQLRELILQEPDNLDTGEFPVKVGLWLRLNQIEARSEATAFTTHKQRKDRSPQTPVPRTPPSTTAAMEDCSNEL